MQVHLEPKDVPAHLRAGYTGKKFQARVSETYTIPGDVGLWSGGSRTSLHWVRLADGKVVDQPGQDSSPFVRDFQDKTVAIQPGFAAVEHVLFCGKDLGLRFYVHPSDAAALLPPPAPELDPIEKAVLEVTCAYKSGYRKEEYRRLGLADAQVERAKASLVGKGMLTKTGAVTVAGRNARSNAGQV